MKDINTVLSELIQLDSIETINKNTHGGLVIIMAATFNDGNSKPILDILNGYQWEIISRPNDIHSSMVSFIKININIKLINTNSWTRSGGYGLEKHE